jgi:23S rRNA-/tRNA-specific pseudouridylate synthase
VYGRVTPQSFLIDAPIDEGATSNTMQIGVNGRAAQTHVTVLAYGKFNGRDASKALLRPISGRRHQLRVHMLSRGAPRGVRRFTLTHALTGHPVIGDLTYCADYDAPRMMLHAAYLSLPLRERPLTLVTADPFVGYLSDVEVVADAAMATASTVGHGSV